MCEVTQLTKHLEGVHDLLSLSPLPGFRKVRFAIQILHALADSSHRPILVSLSAGLEALDCLPAPSNLKDSLLLLAKIRQMVATFPVVPDEIDQQDKWLLLYQSFQSLDKALTARVVPLAERQVIEETVSSETAFTLDLGDKLSAFVPEVVACRTVANTVKSLESPPLPDYDSMLVNRAALEPWFTVLFPLLQHHAGITEDKYGPLAANYSNILQDFSKVLSAYTESLVASLAELRDLSSQADLLVAAIGQWDFKDFADTFKDEASLTKATESLQKVVTLLSENTMPVARILTASKAFPASLQQTVAELTKVENLQATV